MKCIKTGINCQYCSDEKRVKHQVVGIIKTHLLERRDTKISLGQFCNNDGKHFVSELKDCPIPGAKSIPLVPYEMNELDWMRKKS